MSDREARARLARAIAAGDFAAAGDLLRAALGQALDQRNSPARTDGERLPAVCLAEAFPGREVWVEVPAGRSPCLLLRRTLADVDAESLGVAAEYEAVMKGARQRFDELEASAEVCRVADARPGDLLFLDIETCGLAGAAVFLVGMMFHEEGQLVFEQCLARDYDEEAAVLQAFLDRYAGMSILVTFNGRAFDMSMIRERAAYHGLDWPDRELPHMDLLLEVRRRWKRELPNCRLTTVERSFYGRRRVGDISGGAIPGAYQEFVSTGDARKIGRIVRHNALDLLTLAQVVVAVLTSCRPEGDAL